MSDDPYFAMSSYWYEQWYRQKVAPNLSRKQKMELVKKISDFSLREPIFHSGLHYPKKDWPILAPYSSTDEITGIQLYAVLMAASRELGFPTTLGSTYNEKPIMPDLPVETSRFRQRDKKSFSFEEKENKLKSKIGSDLVPSVETLEGCKQVDGKWLSKYGVCVLSDGNQGYTAPVKGVYFFWSKKPSWETESIGACHVYGDDFYPRGIGTCKSKIDLGLTGEIRNPRLAALQAASNVMHGRGKNVNYFNPRGEVVRNSGRNAIAGNSPSQVKKLYSGLNLSRVKPFRLRRQ